MRERGGLSSMGGGVDGAVYSRDAVDLSVPSVRAAYTCRVVATKLSVIVHDFTHQLFDQVLADHTVLAAG
jgi:hypothetical protein